MKILITSPRAPAALEWIALAQQSGHVVTVVDVLKHPIGRSVTGVEYVQIPSPRFAYDAYVAALLPLIETHDLVIPTCEDIFYVSTAVGDHTLRKKVLVPQHELLLQLHNKYTVQTFTNEHARTPHTALIEHIDQVDLSWRESLLKPVFSRFGTEIVYDITKESISGIECSKEHPWIQQEFIAGEYFCNYAVIDNGDVLTHAVYKPKYLVNNAAGTYFEPIHNEACEQFVATFAKEHGITGQVAFDFIENDQGLYVLECNPRTTSGIHLAAASLQITEDGLSRRNNASTVGSCRVGVSIVLIFGIEALWEGRVGELLRDYWVATNVIKGVSPWAQLRAFVEVVRIARHNNISFAQATALDIEYNG